MSTAFWRFSHPARTWALPVALLAAVSCATARPATTRTEAAPDPAPLAGTVSVLATADSKACKDPRECVQADAVRALLFVGVPGSAIPRPMVANEQEATRDHRAFFTDLLDKKGYGRFIVRVSEGRPTSPSHADEKAWTVVVNTDALRRALEEAGVVRRFGY